MIVPEHALSLPASIGPNMTSNAVIFDPYHDDSSCYTAERAQSYISSIMGYGFEDVVLYGTKCNQTKAIFDAVASRENITATLGFASYDAVNEELDGLIEIVDGRWNSVSLVGLFSEDDTFVETNQMRDNTYKMVATALKTSGYKGNFIIYNLRAKSNMAIVLAGLLQFLRTFRWTT